MLVTGGNHTVHGIAQKVSVETSRGEIYFLTQSVHQCYGCNDTLSHNIIRIMIHNDTVVRKQCICITVINVH